jgi:hypothetical protein
LDLPKPPLPLKTKKGITIYPRGFFSGWYFSPELKNARDNFGCTITPKRSYKFESSDLIFKEFVEDLYTIKYIQDNILRFFGKIGNNSLYGKFGAKEYNYRTQIYTKDEVNKLHKTHEIYNIVELDENREIVTHEIHPNEEKCNENEIDYVFVGTYNDSFIVNPDEVADYKWVTLENLLEDVSKNSQNYTFWFKEILKNDKFTAFIASNLILV